LGRVIQFDYNWFDQVIEERWYTSGMSLVRTLEFTFDDAGQLTEATGIGCSASRATTWVAGVWSEQNGTWGVQLHRGGV
jgi:hypothetical protein